MKIRLSDYKNVRKSVLEMYDKHGIDRVLEMCTYTFIPIIVAYSFLKEEHGGFDKEIESLNKFYGYKEIIK